MIGTANHPGGPNPPSAPTPTRRSIQSTAVCRLLVLVALSVVSEASQPAASAAAPAQSPTQAPASHDGASQTDHRLPQVTVQANRDVIEPQVRAFVDGSVYLENDEAPARWNSPVCPAVAGLSHSEAEFMLARLSQIARAAGVPLGGNQCTPANLYVVATAKPEVFLKWAGAHWRLFDGTPMSVVNDFVTTPRPVRVWYNSKQVGSDTAQLGTDSHTGMSIGAAPQAATFSENDVSRITRNVVWSLTSAVVVVDKTRLRDVNIGQLTDYISMYALSRLKTPAHFGDAPTILGLFDDATSEGVSAQAPQGLTPWDDALLESLYHTNPKLVLQRTMMVTRMVTHIVPGVPAGTPSR